MDLLATIPRSGNRILHFRGCAIGVDDSISLLHTDYSSLARRVCEESGINSGKIPVMLYDPENNFVAATFTVEDGRWLNTTIEGYTGNDGRWTSYGLEVQRARVRREHG